MCAMHARLVSSTTDSATLSMRADEGDVKGVRMGRRARFWG